MSNKNIVIIGAGVAGLAAGRLLAESGKAVTIVEARNRIGGRIYTHRSGNETFELGAEFVHGLPPDLWELIREADLRTEEMDGEQICQDNESPGKVRPRMGARSGTAGAAEVAH
jgi:phytoene dehydrogenase-like protein